jgi:hypothetical protein
MSLRTAMIPLTAIVLAACGTPTPYAPATVSGYGYAAQQIEDNRFRVAFTGNTLTDRRTVENYLLYQAAEVTLAQGGDYFIVIDRDTEADVTYHTTYDGFWPAYDPFPYSYYRRRPYGPGLMDSGTSRPITRYAAQAEIVIRSGRKPEDDPRAFDARQVVRNLGPTIVRLAP